MILVGYNNHSTLQVVNSAIEATRSAQGYGGAIFIFGAGGLVYELNVELYNTRIADTASKYGGGAIALLGGAHKLHHSEKLEGYWAPSQFRGGEMQLLNTFIDRAATDIDGTAGSISHGGAIYISNGRRKINEKLPMFNLTLRGGSALTDCTAAGPGGAAYVDGYVAVSLGMNGMTFDSASVTNCAAKDGDGGGLYIVDNGGATLYVGPGSEIVGCSADKGRGTAVFVTGANSIQFSPTAVINASAVDWGGAARATTTSTVSELIYVGNAQQRTSGLPTSTPETAQSSGAATAVAAVSCAPGASLVPMESTEVEFFLTYDEDTQYSPTQAKVSQTSQSVYGSQLVCQSCPSSTYSLVAGHGNSSASMRARCERCPEGAMCFQGDRVVAEEEQWIEPWSQRLVDYDNDNDNNLVKVWECVRCAGCVSEESDHNVDAQQSAEPNHSSEVPTLDAVCSSSGSRNQCKKNRRQPFSNATHSIENTLCGACIRNETHTFVELGEECMECNSVNLFNILLTLSGYLLYVFWLIWMATADVSTGLFNIALYFVQVLGLVLGPVSEWAPALSVVGNLDVSKYFCFGPMTKVQRLWWGLLSPLGYFMALGVIVGINKCNRRRPKNSITRRAFSTNGTSTHVLARRQGLHLSEMTGADTDNDNGIDTDTETDTNRLLDDDDDDQLIGANDVTTIVVDGSEEAAIVDGRSFNIDGAAEGRSAVNNSSRTFVRCACYLMMFSYESWTEQSLQLLNCIDVGNHSVVAEHPDVSCRSDDNEYRALQAAAIVLTVVVVVGFPVGMLIFLWNSSRLGLLENARFQSYAGILYEHYTPEVQWWWLPQELLRRTLLITLHVASAGRSALRGWLLGATCAIFFGVHVWYVAALQHLP